MANYALTFVIDAPKLLQEGVDVSDFPVPLMIPISHTSNLYGTGETADTIYFECEGEQLKHELIEITSSYLYAWIKMDLEVESKKAVTLHYGALVDNNYEDKRAVWVNGAYIYHFHGNSNDTMGNANGTPSGTYGYGYQWGTHYQGLYLGASISGIGLWGTLTKTVEIPSIPMPFTFVFIGRVIPHTYNTAVIGTYAAPILQITTTGTSVFTFSSGTATAASLSWDTPSVYTLSKYVTGNNVDVTYNGQFQALTYSSPSDATKVISTYLGDTNNGSFNAGQIQYSELWIFTDAKSIYWKNAITRMYRNPDAYIEYGYEVDLDNLTDFTDEKVCCIANIVRQLEIYDYDFKKMVYEVGDKNAYWRVPGSSEGIYVWGKFEMRPLYGEDVSFVDNLYANDAYFYTFTDYQYDIHDKLDVEGVIYDIQAIQVHDAGRETIYKTLILKRQPEYYACCVGIVS